MTRQFTITQPHPQVVEIRAGARGPRGPQGPRGPDGLQGDSLTMRGNWVNGATYCPGDAVVAASSASDGITSLFIQNGNVPCSPSAVEPRADGARWLEVGYREWGGAIGNVWRHTQQNHGIDMVGLPVRYDPTINAYVPATAITLDLLALAVVREIPDADTIILQSSGLVPNIDPRLNFTNPAGGIEAGGLYYLSATPGRVEEAPPVIGIAQIVYRAVDGGAVVFPYQDVDAIVPPPPAPMPATSHVRIDPISGSFDDVTTDFPLLAGTAPIAVGPAESFFIYVDGHRQEPNVDYQIVDDGAGNAVISFARAPFGYADFWGQYAVT